MKFRTFVLASTIAFAATLAASAASASTCIGNCGIAVANGVVVAPPGGGGYGFVSTSGGVGGAGQISGIGGGTNGSEFISDVFASDAADVLAFDFNFVTSDGAGFSDYAFAELLTDLDAHVAWLFTARTTPMGNTSPGFDLPANDSTLTPMTSGIIGGGPAWAQLGGSSGACFDEGCGYTGWIHSDYSIAAAGNYKFRFGVTNISDTIFDTGLAYAGLKIDGNVIPGGGVIPEPSTWAMMLMGFGGLGAVLRRRRTLALA